MAGSQFRTDLGTMGSSAAHVNEVNAQIQSQLTSLMSRLEPLQAQWQGAAAGSFTQVKVQWNENARKLNEALRSIGEALAMNQTNYALSDDTNRQGFTGISSVLG